MGWGSSRRRRRPSCRRRARARPRGREGWGRSAPRCPGVPACLQQGDAAAVQGGGGDHVVAGHGQGKDRQGGRGLAGGDEEAADAALQDRDAGGDAVGRRVGQARVDGAQLLQGEAARCLRGVLEGVGGGLVDGQGGRARGGGRGRIRRESAWFRRTSRWRSLCGSWGRGWVVSDSPPAGRRCGEVNMRQCASRCRGDCAAVAGADAQSAAHSTVHDSHSLSWTRLWRVGPGWWTFVTGVGWYSRRSYKCERGYMSGALGVGCSVIAG